MINLTDSAVNAVKSVMSSSPRSAGGLRVMIEAGDCSGFKYKMGLAEEPEPDEIVIECGGLKVFVNNNSLKYCIGTTIDFVLAPESPGFIFCNQDATANCSCGKSFRC